MFLKYPSLWDERSLPKWNRGEESAVATAELGGPLSHVIGGGNPAAKREAQGAFREMRESQLTVVLVDSKYGGRGYQRREDSAHWHEVFGRDGGVRSCNSK